MLVFEDEFKVSSSFSVILLELPCLCDDDDANGFRFLLTSFEGIVLAFDDSVEEEEAFSQL
jgi:hypothetical protein